MLCPSVFVLQTDPGAKDAYWAAHIDPASADGATTFGAHMAFLDRLLARSSSGYYLDSGLSVAGGWYLALFSCPAC